jgi:predicted NAD/FAD-binding protein
VTYNMNILQGLPAGSPLFCVTLNPDAPVDERFVLQRFVYEHPLFNPQSWRAQARRGEINGHQRSWSAGPTGTTVFMKTACAARWTWSTR